jgi:THO complex subunit 1
VSTWIQPEFYSSGKILLLRMSNDLLRRLSSAQNTIFCGRIQLFLARLFPLSEKSALNLMSHFNVENVTTYNKEAGEGVVAEEADTAAGEGEEDEGEMMETDEQADDSSLPIDFNLYHKLWALQEFFCQPSQCYSAEQWKVLTGNVEEVLRAFSSFRLEDVQVSRRKGRKSSLVEYSESHYYAKFLTSEKLMNLQLRDSHFRRHILLQFLVLFNYLVGDVKFKAPGHHLQESQAAWIKEMTESVYARLEETPPQGPQFAAYMRHILKREESWVAWKNEGCPSYEKPSLALSESPYPPLEHLGEVHAKSSKQRHNLGNTELTRLWNICPDNLEACRKKTRKFVPDVQKFIAEPVEQADPVARIDPEYKVINNPNFAWQALRLLSQSSPHFFQNTTAQIKALPEYLEHVAVQTGKDLASQ